MVFHGHQNLSVAAFLRSYRKLAWTAYKHHGVHCVCGQVQQDLLDLHRVHLQTGKIVGQDELDRYITPDRFIAQKPCKGLNQAIHIGQFP